MRLSRRDAMAVLVGAGVVGASGAAALARDDQRDADQQDGDTDAEPSRRLVETLVATATVVYPSAVDNVREFVETYASTKAKRRPAFAVGGAAAVETVDAEAQISFEAPFPDLPSDDRETVLRRVGADTAEPDPDGTGAEQVRYYLVNEVLYALYASPTGGSLVGVENPQGYPGGTESYRRGPRR